MLRHPTWATQWLMCFLVLEGTRPALAFCASQPPHLSDRLYLQVGELKRAYRQYLPTTYDGKTPLPLVFVFHGRSQGGQDIEEITRFSEVAEREQFIAVYLIGIHQHWNDGRKIEPIWGAGNYDDVGFVKALLTHLQRTLAIDPNRVYATGMSNGGMFVQRLACEFSDPFAAVAPVDGTLPQDLVPTCRPTHPLSVIEFHGQRDAYIHWDGGSIRAIGGKTLSVKKTMAYWRAIDACPTGPDILYASDVDPLDRTRVRRERFGLCAAGTEVVLYAIEGGGHTWPGGPPDDAWPFLGAVTRKISATEVIWTFFAEHPKASGASTELAKQPAVPMSNEVGRAGRSPTHLALPTPMQNAPPKSSARSAPLRLLTTSLSDLFMIALRNIQGFFFEAHAISSSPGTVSMASTSETQPSLGETTP